MSLRGGCSSRRSNPLVTGDCFVPRSDMNSFNINTIHAEFITFGDLHKLTGAARTGKIHISWMKRMFAIRAGHLASDALKMKFCVFCDGAFCEQLPVKLDRVIHDGCELTDHQINTGDLAGSSLLAWRSDISRMLWVTASSCMIFEFN
jgi:hypothetical protein